MPTVIFPVPSHSGHGDPFNVPSPPQVRHTSSPVPGVPAGASSPGLMGGVGAEGRAPSAPAGWSEAPGDLPPDWAERAAKSIEAPGSSSPATDSSARSTGFLLDGVADGLFMPSCYGAAVSAACRTAPMVVSRCALAQPLRTGPHLMYTGERYKYTLGAPIFLLHRLRVWYYSTCPADPRSRASGPFGSPGEGRS